MAASIHIEPLTAKAFAEFGDVIGWEISLGGSGLTVGNPIWETADFKHPFGFQRIWFGLPCFPQESIQTELQELQAPRISEHGF